MTDEIPGVAERLAREFADVPPMAVLEAVCSCAGECENDSPLFVEQAARAKLVRQTDPRPDAAGLGPPVSA
jgi:hypothetical protein